MSSARRASEEGGPEYMRPLREQTSGNPVVAQASPRSWTGLIRGERGGEVAEFPGPTIDGPPGRKEDVMPESVDKVIELVGTST